MQHAASTLQGEAAWLSLFQAMWGATTLAPKHMSRHEVLQLPWLSKHKTTVSPILQLSYGVSRIWPDVVCQHNKCQQLYLAAPHLQLLL